jgi:hypothetical protein
MRIKDSIIPLVILAILSCATGYKSGNCIYSYTIIIGENININKSEAENLVFSVLGKSAENGFSAEILFFGFSLGKELFSYSAGNPDNPKFQIYPGRAEILVKIKHNGELKRVFFIKAEGSNRQEIMENLSAGLRNELCE